MFTLIPVPFLMTTIALAPALVIAYIGPGTGLSALGALLALVVGLIVTFFAFVWYPIRRLRRKWRTRAVKSGVTASNHATKP